MSQRELETMFGDMGALSVTDESGRLCREPGQKIAKTSRWPWSLCYRNAGLWCAEDSSQRFLKLFPFCKSVL